jgi:DNA-binding response OmpR family regulator
MTASEREAPRKTVLVVEDDFDARTIYTTTLRHHGFRVIAASTMREAEAAVRAFLPDVVVLDCRLPDGHGLELVSRWRTGTVERVPVIVVTAHAERSDVDAAVLAGADMFVRKPCTGDALTAHVRRALEADAAPRGPAFA